MKIPCPFVIFEALMYKAKPAKEASKVCTGFEHVISVVRNSEFRAPLVPAIFRHSSDMRH